MSEAVEHKHNDVIAWLREQGCHLDDEAKSELLCEASASGDRDSVLRLMLSGCR
jgi:hypothetical protein